jgi:hypothetical protein
MAKKGIYVLDGTTPSGRITVKIVMAGRRYLQSFQTIERRAGWTILR